MDTPRPFLCLTACPDLQGIETLACWRVLLAARPTFDGLPRFTGAIETDSSRRRRDGFAASLFDGLPRFTGDLKPVIAWILPNFGKLCLTACPDLQGIETNGDDFPASSVLCTSFDGLPRFTGD